jgi:hypothetical protein
MLLTINVVPGGCRLIRENSYIHQHNHCVLVILVLGSELSSGGMVGVTQCHCYMKLHYVSSEVTE